MRIRSLKLGACGTKKLRFNSLNLQYNLLSTMTSPASLKSVLLLLLTASNAFSDILDNWHMRDSSGKSVGRIVYGGELFVATGLGGAVLTSPDGMNWTARDSGTTNTLISLTCGNGVFLASGFVNGGYSLYRSTNGINWTQAPWPSYEFISGLGFAEGKLLLFSRLGPSARDPLPIHLSTNGLSWTWINTGIRGATMRSLTSGNRFHVGVGEIVNQAVLGIANASVMISSNFVDWQGIEFSNTEYTYLLDVAFGNGTFVAVGEAQASYPAGVTVCSTNGFNWTLRGTHLVGLASIAFGKGMFVAVQRDGVITTSPDGVNWTLRPTISPVLTGVEFGSDTFVAVGGTNILQSDPLITMHAGRNGQLAIDGRPGRWCRIEYVTELQRINVWQLATNLQLSAQPTFWSDPDAATQPQRFYRTVSE
jgi:hypothetical protein